MPVQLPVRSAELKSVAPSAGSSANSFVDHIPIKLVMMLAAPYLAGRTLEDAITKAHKVWKDTRCTSTIDILGEDVKIPEDCDAFVAQYKQAIDAVASNPISTIKPNEQLTISFKPSMFSTMVPTEDAPGKDRILSEAYARIKSIVHHAKEKNVRVTLEAEDHRWADFHLDTYFSLLNEGYSNLGTVLQARLFRTKDDIKRFDERARVRLVIGIYNEPAEIAFTEKPVMKERLVDYAAELAARGAYIEIASHDDETVGKFFQRVAIPQRLDPNKFETQWLLGVPRKDVQQALVSGAYFKQLAESANSSTLEYLADAARVGSVVRMYLPFGKDNVAGPYCKRRLKANPNMISYGIKNFFHLR